MTYQGILSDIKNKKYAPIYLLHGAEPYYIDAISSFAEKSILKEEEKAFNQAVMYGKDIDFKQVADEARQFPMMAPYRVVIVKEAQDMRTINKLESYAANPSPQSIVILCYKYKKADKRTKWVKNIDKSGVVFESKKIYDNQLSGWITDYLKGKAVNINYDASQLIADYLGADLSKVSNELDKLILNIKDNTVTAKDVQEQIGISKDYNVFEFQKAIGVRDSEKVFRIINYFAENQKSHPLTMVISNLYGFFSKLYITAYNLKSPDTKLQKLLGLPSPFFVKDYKQATQNLGFKKIKLAFHMLQKADLESKGYGSRSKDAKAILTELGLGLMY